MTKSESEHNEAKIKSLIEIEIEIRKYQAAFLSQLSVAFVAVGIIAPALTLLVKSDNIGLVLLAMVCCFTIAAVLFFIGEYQLTKGED